jgi:ATP-dependent RNA helicase DeaD
VALPAEWGEAPSADMIIEKDNERLLANMSLDGEVTEEEQTLVTRLLKAHSPEHIATVFIRQYRDGQSAPEDLLPADYKPSKDDRGPREPRAPREDFSDGVWFSINVGRKQRAEPKWMLPMLMKSGGLKKGEIGAIKIMEGVTYVEVAPKGVDRFLDTIGPDGKIEKAITVTRVDGKPDFAAEKENYRSRDKDRSSGRTRRKPYGDKDGYKGKKPRHDRNREETPKRSRKNSEEKKATSKNWDTPKSEESGFKRKPRKKTHADMPERRDQDYAGAKPKKPHKKKLARAAAKKDGKGTKKGAKKSTRKSRKS